jgi:preprotein translocase subunit SecG
VFIISTALIDYNVTVKGYTLMPALTLALTIVQLLTCLFLIVVVLFQSGKRSGLSGAIAGGADTFMSKEKATTMDGKLAKMTKWVGLAFVALTVALNLLAAAGL